MLDLPLRDMTDAAYRLMVLWFSQEEDQIKQAERVEKHFRDRETEFETGIPVLPGWAGIGDVQARYGDGASPFN